MDEHPPLSPSDASKNEINNASPSPTEIAPLMSRPLTAEDLNQQYLRTMYEKKMAAKAEAAATEARALEEQKERVRDELIAEIIAASGRSYCYASTTKMRGISSHYSDQGEFPRPLQHQLLVKDIELIGVKLNKARSDAGAFEMVSIQPLTVIDTVDEKEIVPNTGMSRFLKPEVEITTSKLVERSVKKEEVYVPGHPRLSEAEENMVLFRYLAKQTEYNSSATKAERSMIMYRDYSNRPGNSFQIDIALPEPVARALADLIRTSPGFARALVEAFVATRFTSGSKPTIHDLWTNSDHPLRPPYDAWDKYAKEHNSDGKRRLCFIDALNEPGVDPLDPRAIATHILQY